MPITREDIARMAGVSRSTVSRVINGDTHVSNCTQHKVQENIHRTNFQPNMAARGVPLLPELVAEGDYSDISGYLAMQRLLPQQPDAVFAASDAMALAAIRAIQEAGLCAPEDIAVLGFDAIPAAATSRPPLTTIRQPILRTASLAAETLIDLIEHPDPQPQRIVLLMELGIRASC